MAGLGGLAAGFQAGFGMMDRHYQNQANQEQRQWQRERAEQQDARQAQLHDLQVGEYERQDQLRGLNALRHQMQHSPDTVDPGQHEILRNPVMQQFKERTKTDPAKFFDPEKRQHTEQAVQWFEQMASGQDNRRPVEVMNDPNTLAASQVLLDELVNENLGETIERDGKTYTIRNKRISSVVPDQSGQGVHVGLTVEAEGPDGEMVEYEAPMTEGHSARDDLVLDVPIDKVMQRVQGHKAMLEGTRQVQDPQEAIRLIESEILKLGGELPEAQGRFEMLQDDQGNPIAQRGPDGRMHDLPQSMRPGGGDSADWRRLNDGSLFNQRTGEVRQTGAGGSGTVGAPGTEAPSSVWAQMRSDYSNRYGLDAEQMMVMLQTHGEDAVNQYMEERAGPNVPNLMDFAREEYGIDPATGTFVRDMRPQFQGQAGGQQGMPQGSQGDPQGVPQGQQSPQGQQGMPGQPGGLPGGAFDRMMDDLGPLGTAAAAQRGPQEPQSEPPAVEPLSFGERESSESPGGVDVPPWANPENAVEMSGSGRGLSGGARLNRDVERAAPYFEARAEGRDPSPGALGMAVRAARQGLLSPEAEADVRAMARRYAEQKESQQR